jgi:hypothetical protein
MGKRQPAWMLAMVLGLGGCAGNDAGAPPSPPLAPAAGKPDLSPGAGSATAAPGASKKEDLKDSEPPPLEPPKTGAARDEAKPVKLTEDQIANIKKLPADEQEAALKQAVCPVSGDPLGDMGTPFKITKEGRTFYLCCDGCVPKVERDPKAIIAKLDGK